MRTVIAICVALAFPATAVAQDMMILLYPDGHAAFDWKRIERCAKQPMPSFHDLASGATRQQIADWESRYQIWWSCKIAWEARQSCALTN